MLEINLDVDYFDHPKTKRLIGLLGKGAEVLPIRLWCYCGKYHAESGLLAGYSAEEIEACVGWWGEPGRFVSAMMKEGIELLEQSENGYYVHDFTERNGHLASFRERAKKGAEARWRKARAGPPPNASSNATSNPQASLKQCSNELSTSLTTTAKDPPAREEATETASAAALVEPETPERRSAMAVVTQLAASKTADFGWLPSELLARWGREGRVGHLVMEEFVGLGKQYGLERLKYAITQAAEHNARTLAYVRGILTAKARQPGPESDKTKRCRVCGNEWDREAEIKRTGSSLCPVCYPSNQRKAE